MTSLRAASIALRPRYIICSVFSVLLKRSRMLIVNESHHHRGEGLVSYGTLLYIAILYKQ